MVEVLTSPVITAGNCDQRTTIKKTKSTTIKSLRRVTRQHQQMLLLLLFLFVLSCSFVPTANARNNHPPVKIFILAGEGNIEGFASTAHLRQLAIPKGGGSTEEEIKGAYQHLLGENQQWATRDDVYVVYDHHRNEDWKHGPLSVHFGGEINSFGPELQLGHFLGDLYEKEKVVIIKTGWKGRSLGKDFAPPSTGSTGFQWHRMMTNIHRVANSLGEILGPDYRYSRPQFAGLVWWQGYTDLADPKMTKSYGDNLVKFITDIRSELRTPYLPVVLAELGGQGAEDANVDQAELDFRDIQFQVANGGNGGGGGRGAAMNETTSDTEDGEEEETTSSFPTLYQVEYVPTSLYVKHEEPMPKDDYRLYFGRADTMMEISQALGVALSNMDYSKKDIGSSSYKWIVNDADITSQRTESFMERRDIKLMILPAAGLFVFVAIMRFGGNMGRTWNTAMDRLRPSDDTIGSVVTDAELGVTENNHDYSDDGDDDDDLRSIPDIRNATLT